MRAFVTFSFAVALVALPHAKPAFAACEWSWDCTVAPGKCQAIYQCDSPYDDIPVQPKMSEMPPLPPGMTVLTSEELKSSAEPKKADKKPN